MSKEFTATPPIKCIFVGDLALGDHPKSVGFGFYSKYCKGISQKKAQALFPEAYEHDIVFGNLEFTLGNITLSGDSHEELNCKGISSYADYIQQAGFNVMNIANNHIYQHGIDAFNNTVELLVGKGIGIVGLRSGDSRPNVIRIGGCEVCFLGWSARPRQGFADQPPYREFDETSCYMEIAAAAKEYSHVCVSMHWGDEFIEIPSDDEKRIARKMIDAGASVVVGHHPHVMREIEEYKGCLIAYSLGNFICDMIWNEKTRKTGFLYVEFDGRTISKWEMVTGRIDDSFFPTFTTESADQTGVYKRLYSMLCSSSYDCMARKALHHHQILTLLHMVRNFWRYRPGVWKSMVVDAIKSRFIANS